MFGYVRVDAPDLRVREKEYYQALYCGLCRAQGHCTGQCSRMTLSYDFVFMAALRMALTGERPEFERRRCPAHPFRRRLSVKNNRTLALCADAAAILGGLKCQDDIGDERGFRRFRARARYRFLRRGFRRAAKRHPDFVGEARRVLAALSELERAGTPSADRPAALCGELTGLSFSLGLDGSAALIAREVGDHVGRWVYLVDALDDWFEDRRCGRYNPLICLYPDAEPGRNDVKENLRAAMLCELADVDRALDLVEYEGRDDLRGMIENIVRRGMPAVAERVLATCGTPAGKRKQDHLEKGGLENDRSV